MGRRLGRGATGDRAATETALEDAALTLLRRNGVLAGLNLREVAEEAGVNRGLVYHYFGSHRDLLRAALRRDVHERLAGLVPRPELDIMARFRAFFETMVHNAESIRLVTALVLDREDRIKLLPYKDLALPDLTDRQQRGELRPELDLEALHIAQVSFGYGYALFREGFARELSVPLDELDRRVEEASTWMACQLLAESQSTATATATDADGSADGTGAGRRREPRRARPRRPALTQDDGGG